MTKQDLRIEVTSLGVEKDAGFVGVKMCLTQVLTVPPFISLFVVITVLAATMTLSLWRTRATPNSGYRV